MDLSRVVLHVGENSVTGVEEAFDYIDRLPEEESAKAVDSVSQQMLNLYGSYTNFFLDYLSEDESRELDVSEETVTSLYSATERNLRQSFAAEQIYMQPNEAVHEYYPWELQSTPIPPPANIPAAIQGADPRTLVVNCTEGFTAVGNSQPEVSTQSISSNPRSAESETDYIASIKWRVMQKWGEDDTNLVWRGVTTKAQAVVWERLAANCDTFGDAVKRINRLIVNRLMNPGSDERALRKHVLWIDMTRATTFSDLPAVTADEMQQKALMYDCRGILCDARLNQLPGNSSNHAI